MQCNRENEIHLLIKQCLAIAFTVIALLGCSGFGAVYHSEAINGKVIDAQSGQPIEGVVVVAVWQMVNKYGTSANRLKILETVTDKKGRYHFPEWGPVVNTRPTYFSYRNPLLILFKPGYDWKGLTNPSDTDANMKQRRLKSIWNGKTIKLVQFKDRIIKEGRFTTSAYAKSLSNLSDELYWVSPSFGCDLIKIPRMLVAMHNQAMEFKRQGLDQYLPDLRIYLDKKFGYRDPCGVRKVVERYLK